MAKDTAIYHEPPDGLRMREIPEPSQTYGYDFRLDTQVPQPQRSVWPTETPSVGAFDADEDMD